MPIFFRSMSTVDGKMTPHAQLIPTVPYSTVQDACVHSCTQYLRKGTLNSVNILLSKLTSVLLTLSCLSVIQFQGFTS